MAKRKFFSLVVSLFVVGILLAAAPRRVNAQEPSAKAQPDTKALGPIEVELVDLTFEKYADVRLLARAVEVQNTERLTDLALQFYFAENILDRKHKLFTARGVAEIAVAAASENADTASLDRLAKLAKKLKDADLSGKIDAAKVAASKATPKKAILVPADSVKVSHMNGYRAHIRMVKQGKILGNREYVEARLAELERNQAMPKELRDDGIRLANEALAAMPKNGKLSATAQNVQKWLDERELARLNAKK